MCVATRDFEGHIEEGIEEKVEEEESSKLFIVVFKVLIQIIFKIIQYSSPFLGRSSRKGNSTELTLWFGVSYLLQRILSTAV